MDCTGCLKLLESHLELDDGSAVAEHLSSCGSCQAVAREIRTVSGLFAAVAPEAPPAGLWSRIEAGARAKARGRPEAPGQGHRFRAWMPRAAAACIGATLVLGWAVTMGPTRAPISDPMAPVTPTISQEQAALQEQSDSLLRRIREAAGVEEGVLVMASEVSTGAEERLLAAIRAGGRGR